MHNKYGHWPWHIHELERKKTSLSVHLLSVCLTDGCNMELDSPMDILIFCSNSHLWKWRRRSWLCFLIFVIIVSRSTNARWNWYYYCLSFADCTGCLCSLCRVSNLWRLVLFGVDEADDQLSIDGSTPTVGNTKQYLNDSKVYFNL